MSDNNPAEQSPASDQENQSALFANLVLQQANMAMMLMGKGPQPEGAGGVKDLEAARLFIDQLEMLEAKTKGNLTREETNLLKQTLMSLQLGFVDAVESAGKASDKAPPQPAAPEPKPETKTAPQGAPSDEDQRKKFSKKY